MAVSGDFIADFFERSSAAIFLCSLANDRSLIKKVSPHEMITRDPKVVDRFSKQWDKKDRGLFFCVATIKKGKRREKKNVAEIVCLHCDLDFSKIQATREEIERVIQALALPPSKVVFSGHGLHCYWIFSEAMASDDDVNARVEAALKQLAYLLAGDPAVCEISRVMRLPGTHNTKGGQWLDVELVADDPDARYSLSQIEEWLATIEQPLLASVEKTEAPGSAAPKNFFTSYGDEHGDFTDPLDIEEMLDDMTYLGSGGGGNVHTTERDVLASLLGRGEPVENAIDYLQHQIRERIPESAHWNWKDEIKELRGMCVTWFAKHAELLEKQDELPEWLVRDKRLRKFIEVVDKEGKPTSLSSASSPPASSTIDVPPAPPPKTAATMREVVAGASNVVQLKTGKKKNEIPVLSVITAHELIKQPIEELEWIVPNFIVKGALNGKFGDGGVGKDLLSFQLAIAMTHEQKFIDMEVAHGRVLYFVMEDDLRELRRRQDSIGRLYKINPDSEDLMIVPMIGAETLLAAYNPKGGIVEETPLMESVRRLVYSFKPMLTIVGNRVNIFGVNQNEDAQARQCLGLLNQLCLDVFNTTVLMPSHASVAGMRSGDGTSGSVQWSNGCRQRLYLSRIPKSRDHDEDETDDPNARMLEVKKANYGPTGNIIRLRWEDGAFIKDTKERSRGYTVIEKDPTITPEEKKRARTAHETAVDDEFLRLLDMMTERGIRVSPNIGGARNNVVKVFSESPSCKYRGDIGRKELHDSMDRLYKRRVVKTETVGPKSKPVSFIVRTLHLVKK